MYVELNELTVHDSYLSSNFPEPINQQVCNTQLRIRMPRAGAQTMRMRHMQLQVRRAWHVLRL